MFDNKILALFYRFPFQYEIIINATTDGGAELTDFEVFVDFSPNKTVLQSDNKTTVDTFVFGAIHTIVVKKVGHQDANITDYEIKDPENVIDLNLPKNRVSQMFDT